MAIKNMNVKDSRKRTQAEIIDYLESTMKKGDRVIHIIKTVDGTFTKSYDVQVE